MVLEVEPKTENSAYHQNYFWADLISTRIWMIITSSRRPGHRTRMLCRDLARVMPDSRYIPRGTKTVEELAGIARRLGQGLIILVLSLSGKPNELRFIEVGEKWRWKNAIVKLEEVKLQSDLGERRSLEDLKIYGDGDEASAFASWLGELLGIEISKSLSKSAGFALVTDEGGLNLSFMSEGTQIGPTMGIKSYGQLYKE
jgi:hypothetical protein